MSAVAGGIATVGDVVLGTSGYGGWGFVPVSILSLGVGKGVSHAARRIIDIRKANNGTVVRVQGRNGDHEYVPSMFTTEEMYGNEIVWRTVKLKGNQAQWAITGHGLSQSFVGPGAAPAVPQSYNGYEDVNPWDLPPNAAYLEDRDGELVK